MLKNSTPRFPINVELKKNLAKAKLMTNQKRGERVHQIHEYMKQIDKGRDLSELKGEERQKWFALYCESTSIETMMFSEEFAGLMSDTVNKAKNEQ